ncbi:glycosyltransferase [Candidatus Saccharibacteria bacterium]|nr:glycosyltransferase [Candidatus Saccharibacteria bacterium]
MKTDPWLIPLNTRIDELKRAKKSGKKVAAILYSEKDLYSSFRYRAYNIYEATKASKKWQLIFFFPNELADLKATLPEIDLLIFGRLEKWQLQYDDLAIIAREFGIKIAFDLDDCICGTKYIKNMFNVVSPDTVDQDYWINTCAHVELLSELTDGFIVTNDYLGKILSESHNKKPYAVIPNFLNHSQIDSAEGLKKNTKGETFTIGYFSGSHTHATDFEVVYPEIIDLLKSHKNFKLKIVGMLTLPKSADKFIKNGQIEFTKIVDFLTLQKLVSSVDVNIAPLADNVFTNCKSELKFFEAALVKTPTIASPTYAFSHSIKHGKTGLLCQPGEWTEAILRIYNEPKFAKSLAENAHEYVKEHYYPEAVIRRIEDTYDSFIQK